MADSTSAVAGSPVSGEDLARVEKFTFEPFIHEGDDPAVVLAENTPRRRAFDEALAEIEAGLDQPSLVWRQKYSLMLGLERLMSQEEPKLADGTLLNPHQVDALSGTLIALIAELQNSNGAASNGAAANGGAAIDEVDEDEDEDEPNGEEDDEDWDGDEDEDEDDGDSEDEEEPDDEGASDWDD